ncbi:MAG: site-specific DNA-methyltransferase [Candidatus Latescibacteria bacterium]|nr:site-specific DNA-methyltransferase [Candidatus Latescibacterota bacterium]
MGDLKTLHTVFYANSENMKELKTESVDLVITSPPYPMIEMWDVAFTKQNPEIGDALRSNDGNRAFELMNRLLDNVWSEVYRVVKPGGIVCINVGDATRKINGDFKLYPSHSRIMYNCLNAGFQALPEILWRKQTNAPNKFMGSGMLPPGAYVTLEHEFILVLRKGGKREFAREGDKIRRRRSGFFWEERNVWFSDVWLDLKGAKQDLDDENLRKRSAAFPFELAYRLVNMFSVKEDLVLDPFLGTGTSMAAAMASCRNSIGYEIDANFGTALAARTTDIVASSNQIIDERLARHIEFVKGRTVAGRALKYRNEIYGFPVMTRQEVGLLINDVREIRMLSNQQLELLYDPDPQEKYCRLYDEHDEDMFDSTDGPSEAIIGTDGSKSKDGIMAIQRDLF